MNWKNNILLFITLLVLGSCKQDKSSNVEKDKEGPLLTIEAPSFSSVIQVTDLDSLLRLENTKLIQFDTPEMYAQGHITGALNVWRTDIENPSYSYKGMMCSKSQLETLFSNLGINNDDLVVLYDRDANCNAARLWWILKNYGFHNIKILDGGIQAWLDNNRKLTKKRTVITPSVFTLPEDAPMNYYVSKENVLEALQSAHTPIILDTRTANEYTGLRQKRGAKEAGRIPESILADWAHSVNYKGDKKFKSLDELEAIYTSTLPDKEQPIIVYCHSGVRSAHTNFVLSALMGYKNIKNYDGSWVEWSHFENYPKVRDSVTTIFK